MKMKPANRSAGTARHSIPGVSCKEQERAMSEEVLQVSTGSGVASIAITQEKTYVVATEAAATTYRETLAPMD
jgi:methylase of polypeptide subunit release factors